MDEYCIVPKRVIDATQKDLPASHPAESKDVISLTGLINRILSREDDDWKKASILSSTLERYMALTAEKRESGEQLSFSIPQDVPVPLKPSVPSAVKITKVPTVPLVRKQKRSAADVELEKRLKNGPDVESVPTPKPRPSLRQSDVMDTQPVPDIPLQLPTAKPRSKVKPMLQMSDVMDLSDVFAEPTIVTQVEPVTVAVRTPVG